MAKKQEMKKYAIGLCFFFLFSDAYSQKLTDTIFYNNKWEICEKPIAEYYRLGTLAVDSFWFFTGPIEDYTVEGILVMKGNYSQDGYKNGLFEFYYPDGKPRLKGKYIRDNMRDTWEYYYENGTHKASIYFPEDKSHFIFTKFTDKNGKIKLENGTGEFNWRQNELEPANNWYSYDYKLFGEYKENMRTGTWKYYLGDDVNINTLRYKEFYEKGRLKKVKRIGYYTENVESANIRFDFEPEKIATTEKILYDEFLTKRDSTGKKEDNFVNYIINGQSPVITVEEKEFGKAFEKILATLDRYRYKIDYNNKDIEGEIEFKISDKGYPEDVTITGNITEKEKKFIRYIMDKFKGIEMPTIDNTIGLEGYHKFYFFSFNTHPFMPIELWDYIPKYDFVFSFVKKDKFVEFAKTLKPVFRKIMNRR